MNVVLKKGTAKGIRVILVFEYDDIPDPDCEMADYVTELLSVSTDSLADEFKADRCYVSDTVQCLHV